MPDKRQESRTLIVDKGIIEDLCDISLAFEAVDELPGALTTQEVDDIGIQANLTAGVSELKEGRRLEQDAIFNLGWLALADHRGDLVTAESAKKVLNRRGIRGRVMSKVLGWEVKKAQKRILTEIIGE